MNAVVIENWTNTSTTGRRITIAKKELTLKARVEPDAFTASVLKAQFFKSMPAATDGASSPQSVTGMKSEGEFM